MAEEIIFRVGADTSGAQKGVNDLDKDINKLGADTQKVGDSIENQFADIQKRVESGALTGRQLTKAIREYQTIALQAGEESPIGQRALAAAGELQDRLGDIRSTVNVLAHDGASMQAALQLGQTVLAGYGALQGITALVGQESEQLTQTLVKLQAIESALVAVEQIRAALEAESFLMIKANTIAQQAYNVVVGESVGAMKALRLALAGLGIGAVIAGIIYLISAWDDLTGSTNDAAIAQEGFNDTIEDYNQGIATAAEETKSVAAAFDLAREGVISKEEALQTYNETLGDAFGKASDLNEAERLFAEKTDAYIEAAGKRAQAQAFFAKAAEAQADALTAQYENQTTVLDNVTASLYGYVGGQQALLDKTAEQQKQRVKEAEENHKRLNRIFTEQGEAYIKDAEELENTNGIKSESEQKLAAEKEKLAKEAEEKAKERREKERQEELKRQQELLRLQRQFIDLTIANIQERGLREQAALAEKHRRELEDLRTQYGERADLIRQLEENQEIERRQLDNQILAQDKVDREAADKEREEQRKKRVEAESTLGKTLIAIMQDSATKQREIDDAVFASKALLANNVASILGNLSTLAKEGSDTQKALALTEIAINTAVGFVNGLRIAQQAAAATGPAAAFAFPIFYASQIGAVLSAANKAKSILGAGSSVSPPTSSTSSGVVSSGVGQNITQQPALGGNTSTTQTGNKTAQPVLVIQSFKQIEGQYNLAEQISTYP